MKEYRAPENAENGRNRRWQKEVDGVGSKNERGSREGGVEWGEGAVHPRF